MASTGIYNRILKLIEKWPVDKNKPGRDFGEYLKEQLTQAQQTKQLQGKEQHWDRQYLALQRIINNEHFTKYPRGLSSTATGLSAEQCNQVLTKESLELLERENISFLKRIFTTK